jgi:hypothetical protein
VKRQRRVVSCILVDVVCLIEEDEIDSECRAMGMSMLVRQSDIFHCDGHRASLI